MFVSTTEIEAVYALAVEAATRDIAEFGALELTPIDADMVGEEVDTYLHENVPFVNDVTVMLARHYFVQQYNASLSEAQGRSVQALFNVDAA